MNASNVYPLRIAHPRPSARVLVLQGLARTWKSLTRAAIALDEKLSSRSQQVGLEEARAQLFTLAAAHEPANPSYAADLRAAADRAD